MRKRAFTEPPLRESATELLKEGKLQKLSPSIFRNWQLRTFRLYTRELLYSQHENWEPKGHQRVDLSIIVEVQSTGAGEFELLTDTGRSYKLKAESVELAESWIFAIEEARQGQVERLRRTVGEAAASFAQAETGKLQAEVRQWQKAATETAEEGNSAIAAMQEEAKRLRIEVEHLRQSVAVSTLQGKGQGKSAISPAQVKSTKSASPKLRFAMENEQESASAAVDDAGALVIQEEASKTRQEIDRLRKSLADARHEVESARELDAESIGIASAAATKEESEKLILEQASADVAPLGNTSASSREDVAANISRCITTEVAVHTECDKPKDDVEQQAEVSAGCARRDRTAMLEAQEETREARLEVEQLQQALADARSEAASAVSVMQLRPSKPKPVLKRWEMDATLAAREEVCELRSEVESLQQAVAATSRHGEVAASLAESECITLKITAKRWEQATAEAVERGNALAATAQEEAGEIRTCIAQLEEVAAGATSQREAAALEAAAAQEEANEIRMCIAQLEEVVAGATSQRETAALEEAAAQEEANEIRICVAQLEEIVAGSTSQREAAALEAAAAQEEANEIRMCVAQLEEVVAGATSQREAAALEVNSEFSKMKAEVWQWEKATADAMDRGDRGETALLAAHQEARKARQEAEHLRNALTAATQEVESVAGDSPGKSPKQTALARQRVTATAAARKQADELKLEVKSLQQALADARQRSEAAASGEEFACINNDLAAKRGEGTTVDAAEQGHVVAITSQNKTSKLSAYVAQLQEDIANATSQREAAALEAHAEFTKLKADMQQLEEASADAADQSKTELRIAWYEAHEARLEVEHLTSALTDARQQVKLSGSESRTESHELTTVERHREFATASLAQPRSIAAVATWGEANEFRREVEYLRQAIAEAWQQGKAIASVAETECSELNAEVQHWKQAASDAAEQGNAASVAARDEAIEIGVHTARLQENVADATSMCEAGALVGRAESTKKVADVQHGEEVSDNVAPHDRAILFVAQGGAHQAKAEVVEFRQALADAVQKVDAAQEEATRLKIYTAQLKETSVHATSQNTDAAGATHAESPKLDYNTQPLEDARVDVALRGNATILLAQEEARQASLEVGQLQQALAEARQEAEFTASRSEAAVSVAEAECSKLKIEVQQWEQIAADAKRGSPAATAAQEEVKKFRIDTARSQKNSAQTMSRHESAASPELAKATSSVAAEIDLWQSKPDTKAWRKAAAAAAEQSNDAAVAAEEQANKLRRLQIDVADVTSHNSTVALVAPAESSRVEYGTHEAKLEAEELRLALAEARHEAKCAASESAAQITKLQTEIKNWQMPTAIATQPGIVASVATSDEASNFRSEIEHLQRAVADARQQGESAAHVVKQWEQKAADAAQQGNAAAAAAQREVNNLRVYADICKRMLQMPPPKIKFKHEQHTQNPPS